MAERQRLTEEDETFIFPGDDEVSEEELESDELEEDGDDTEQGQPEPSEPEPFTLSKDSDPNSGRDNSGQGQGKPETVEIIHRGQVHHVTKEKAIELAQKGFDYDVKVGPHARLARLVDSDPSLAQEIDQAIRRRMSGQPAAAPQPEPDPFDGMDDDEPITAAEARKAFKAQQERELARQNQQAQQRPMQTSAPQQPGGLTPAQQMLLNRDPANFRQVAPRLQEFARKLSMEDYQRIDSDPAALVQFYDYVKQNVVGQQAGQQQQPNPNPGNPAPRPQPGSFRARSGGGNPSRQKTDEQKIWDLPNAEFEKQIARFKGLA